LCLCIMNWLGTLRGILKQAHVTLDEFVRNL